MPSSTKDFKKLQREWYKKLKESGFEDAEQPDGNMKVWTANYFITRHSPERFEAQRTYFEMATRFLNEYEFQTPREKFAWELHSEGATIREIERTVRAKYGRSSKDYASKMIKSLTEKMLDKYRAK